jgi:hypothetical protein
VTPAVKGDNLAGLKTCDISRLISVASGGVLANLHSGLPLDVLVIGNADAMVSMADRAMRAWSAAAVYRCTSRRLAWPEMAAMT